MGEKNIGVEENILYFIYNSEIPWRQEKFYSLQEAQAFIILEKLVGEKGWNIGSLTWNEGDSSSPIFRPIRN